MCLALSISKGGPELSNLLANMHTDQLQNPVFLMDWLVFLCLG